jgi:PAS domain S-box-containing protein
MIGGLTKLIPVFSKRWYVITSYGMLSATVSTFSSGLLIYALRSRINLIEVFPKYYMVVIYGAAVHIVYSIFLYLPVLKRSDKTNKLLNLGEMFLYATFIASAIFVSTDPQTPSFLVWHTIATWLIFILVSGLYGWLNTVLLTISSSMIALWISSSGDYNDQFSSILPVLIASVGVASLMTWRYLVTTFREDDNRRRRTVSEVLSPSLLINSIADGVIILDGQGIINEFNPPATNITGWDAEDAQGLNYKSVLVFETSSSDSQASDPIAQSMSSNEVVKSRAFSIKSQSSSLKEIDMIVSPIQTYSSLDDTQITVGSLVIFRDVSEERAEERRRGEFISTASHEMRTPVAAIEGYLALALNDKVSVIDSRARSYLQKAHDNTKRLGQLFQDLLTSSKAEDGRLVNHPYVIEMGQMLEQTIEELRFTAESKNLELVGQFTSPSSGDLTNKNLKPLYYTLADPDRIREVITNLFDNAVKYTTSGKITIGLTGDETSVQFFISDTGQGIPPENVPHLFQKFYRVDNSDTRTIGGTGLGLFICKEIVSLYNGKIWAESKLNSGSTFYVSLPRFSTHRALEQANLQNPTSGAKNVVQ